MAVAKNVVQNRAGKVSTFQAERNDQVSEITTHTLRYWVNTIAPFVVIVMWNALMFSFVPELFTHSWVAGLVIAMILLMRMQQAPVSRINQNENTNDSSMRS